MLVRSVLVLVDRVNSSRLPLSTFADVLTLLCPFPTAAAALARRMNIRDVTRTRIPHRRRTDNHPRRREGRPVGEGVSSAMSRRQSFNIQSPRICSETSRICENFRCPGVVRAAAGGVRPRRRRKRVNRVGGVLNGPARIKCSSRRIERLNAMRPAGRCEVVASV